MTSLIPLLAVAVSAAAAAGLAWYLRKQGQAIPWSFVYLTFVLPFAAGGFHSYVCALTVVVLLAELILTARRKRQLRMVLNGNSLAVLLVTLGYCVTPLWAADQGMAVFGIVRFLPVALYGLVLMQYTPEERTNFLRMIPFCGAFMTVFSCALLPIPELKAYLTVNGRLSGFLQYPNTFAAFLLAGLVLQNAKPARNWLDRMVTAILIFGIVLSGSRTGFVLLAVALVGIGLIQRKFRPLLFLAGAVLAGLALGLAASRLGILKNADRFTSISVSAGSFLVRLLYYKDALPVILKHPFGLGYLGYRALEGTFQTGRYYISFVHNGLLQLLLDIGWIPALAIAASFLRGIISQRTTSGNRLLLIVVLGHCMLDFDLQFFVFWAMLLFALDFDTGKQFRFQKGKPAGLTVCAAVLAACLWLGVGDLCYSLGKLSACLAITPFHTDALYTSVQTTSDSEELDALADRILALNPTNSLAYSAKANAALAQGKVPAMMEYKEQAIRCARFTTAEYLDYFEKLYTVMQLYLQTGDISSAVYCRDKLLQIPEMMEAVAQQTDPLAKLTGDDSTLALPEEYTAILDILADSF